MQSMGWALIEAVLAIALGVVVTMWRRERQRRVDLSPVPYGEVGPGVEVKIGGVAYVVKSITTTPGLNAFIDLVDRERYEAERRFV